MVTGELYSSEYKQESCPNKGLFSPHKQNPLLNDVLVPDKDTQLLY